MLAGEIVVTGAAGRVGGCVVEKLAGQGVKVRAVTRRPIELVPGCDGVVADLNDADAVAAAVAGCSTVVLITADVPDRVHQQRNVANACRAAEVAHIVNLSSRSAGGNHPYSFGVQQSDAERILNESGVTTTHVRPGFFMQNLFVMARPIAAGFLPLPIGREAVAMVDARDVVDALCAVAIAEPSGEGHSVTLTGPRPLVGEDVASAIAAAVGHEVRFVPTEPREAADGFQAAGLPAEAVPPLLDLFAGLAAGRQNTITDDLADLLRRTPRDVTEFAADHAPAFVLG